ncbi:MAG: type II toxin-antitoxin system VapC family toxin [Candidatus Kerfeldbacteria bacterium]|nr:type II toxin-antitoxin system VapC family toxin [Candidatus Kerfeldbacteria bacterium]
MFLIDTNVLILGLAGKMPDAKFLQHVIEDETFCLSVITVAEFFTRASGDEEKILEKLFHVFLPLAIDENVAKQAGWYRKKYFKKSQAKLPDYFLAAQAKVYRCTLVTHNTRDFPMKDIEIVSP